MARSRAETIPLSFAQQRLWFLHRMEGPSATYNIPRALRLQGRLNPEALQAALGDLVARHESLRTRFVETDGFPRQEVLGADDPRASLALEYRSVSAGTLRAELSHAAAHCFRLDVEIPLRATLFAVSTHEHVLLLLLHHIACDGWSMGPLLRDLSQAYGAQIVGRVPDFAPLPAQYGDYTLWQRDLLGEEQNPDSRLARQAAYWRQTLAGLPDCITLPTDRPRPPASSYRGDKLPFHIPAALQSGLRGLAASTGATLFMVLQAGLAVLLSKLGAGEDIAIGSVIAGRTDSALDDLVGFFINTLVLRTDLSGAPSVCALLDRVRHQSLAAYTHQDLPFERLVEMINPARAQNHHPLFQVMISFNNNASARVDLPELTLVSEPFENSTAKFDLTFYFSDRTDGLEGSIEYAADLFDPATVERYAQRLLRILQAMTADPDQQIQAIDVLDPRERRLLLETWNETQAPYPADRCIHQLFEAQVDLAPDATALVNQNLTLSYAQLNAQANRLAHHLIALGVRPDDRVAICLERSPTMVVGLLAILKAGAAYLPLDPAYPAARLSHILQDAKPALLLTDATRLAALDPNARQHLEIIDLDRPHPPWDALSPLNPDPGTLGLTSRHLAYVIYTSGSTGTPKGVMVEHRNVVKLAVDDLYIHLSRRDRVLHASNTSFDAATFEIWSTILNGAELVILARNEILNIPQFAEILRSSRHSTIFTTTAIFNEMVSYDPGVFQNLKHVLFGGENANTSHVQKVLTAGPPDVFLHLYGPTECTAFSSSFEISADSFDPESFPIGRPIANTRIYLLDIHGDPVPQGAIGEIHIGGSGVARGYLNRPELTAERFIPSPFVAGDRLYKTGDLARYRPDGNLIFLGRNDQQVKIRGFRIELGEIEARLAEHPAVRDATVLVREDQPGDRRLVAYVVPRAGHHIEPRALRGALAAALPDYMIPAAIVVLDALPLTPNGKLDRKALFAPEEDAYARQAYAPPQGAIEQTLADIWATLLGLRRVGRHDSFFDLGGHSLLAVRMIDLCSRSGLVISVSALFSHPTLMALAAAIQAEGESAGSHDEIGRTALSAELDPRDAPQIEPPSPAISKPQDSKPQDKAQRRSATLAPHRALYTIQGGSDASSPMFCVPGAGDSIAVFAPLAEALGPRWPVHGLQPRGLVDGETPHASVESAARYYVKALLAQHPSGQCHLLGHSFGGWVVFEMAAQLRRGGCTPLSITLVDTIAPGGEPPELTRVEALLNLVHLFEFRAGDPLNTRAEDLQQLSPDAQIAFLHQRLSQAGLISQHIRPQDLAAIFETVLMNLRTPYYPQIVYHQPVQLIRASESSEQAVSADRWRAWAPNLQEHRVQGNHVTLLQPPHVAELAQHLAPVLSDPSSRNPPRGANAGPRPDQSAISNFSSV
jgi:amino acid adenylation domain-containing protein